MQIRTFVDAHFKHFNAARLQAAAEAYRAHVEGGGKVLLCIGGAMSTAELGISIAEMVRQDKVHAISCTGANLEEDLYNLIAQKDYRRVANYEDLTPEDEYDLCVKGFNRVTDVCIPETEAMRFMEDLFMKEVAAMTASGERCFPHEVFYRLVLSGVLDDHMQVDRSHSWMVAAAERKLPIFVPGWEDSTMGNMYAARVFSGEFADARTLKTGVEYMVTLTDWYARTAERTPIGFFQIGGGIAGDFPICVVPLLQRDLKRESTPHWAYFCQITDSTTSYGSYSGAAPNEKISWGKLAVDTPRFSIESDATIVAPLIFAYVLGW
jgi:deoxyhypusine synthase